MRRIWWAPWALLVMPALALVAVAFVLTVALSLCEARAKGFPRRRAGGAIVLTALALLAVFNAARARDGGQWSEVEPAIAAWFATLMQPDHPRASCCGEADAYWADRVETGPAGETIAVITDARDDGPLRRPHVEPGTRIVVPEAKIKWDQGNPTGHVVIFLGYDHRVYCYVQNGGV